MRIEIILFIAAAALIYNIYTDGKYIKYFFAYKKYYQMAGIALGAIFLYYVIKKNPLRAHEMIAASNDYMKYAPIDRNTSNLISPILNFTKNNISVPPSAPSGTPFPYLNLGNLGGGGLQQRDEARIRESGKKATKRSVSETKKKFVAAQQNWMCGKCQKQLPAWFEVDHKIRLEYGGSNHVDNLVALCRDCHGKKTTIENL
jgi:hypothetical protein